MAERETNLVTRREVVKALAAAPVVCALGCGGAVEGKPIEADDMGGEVDAATEPDAGSDEDMATEPEDAGEALGWATGGTAAMVAKAGYPDPFAGGIGAACEVTCATTIGPCHTTSPERVDVSDGVDGLPVQLVLRVVNEACEPIEDVVVEIWHTNFRGSYSGDIVALCNETAEDARRGYFRGYQRTDADGVVRFETCYPGWYPGRAVHIHFRVQTGGYEPADDAPAEAISQIYFPDELNDEIFTTQPLYSEFGLPNRTLTTDGIIGPEADKERYICDFARMSDGAMQASATIVLTEGASCEQG